MLRRCAMERDERDLADALDHHWDTLLRGEARSAPADLDADLAALVTRLQAVGRALPSLFPDPDQSWRDMRHSLTPLALGWGDGEATAAAWPNSNGYADLFVE